MDMEQKTNEVKPPILKILVRRLEDEMCPNLLNYIKQEQLQKEGNFMTDCNNDESYFIEVKKEDSDYIIEESSSSITEGDKKNIKNELLFEEVERLMSHTVNGKEAFKSKTNNIMNEGNAQFKGSQQEFLNQQQTNHDQTEAFIECCAAENSATCSLQDNSTNAEQFVEETQWMDGFHNAMEMPFVCTQCPYITTYNSDFIVHLKVHNDKPFSCVLCEFRAATNTDLIDHIRLHTHKLSHCYKCSYRAINKPNIITHTSGMLFSCRMCSFRTDQKAMFECNTNKHNPISCLLCSFTTKERHILITHIRKKHSSEKPYSCGHCLDQLDRIDQTSLKRHLKTHKCEKSYDCEHCSYRTAFRNYLRRHLKTHESEKPYGCEHCSYRTADRYSLTRHLKIHASEKPYGCKHCSYRTVVRNNLTRHLQTHESVKPYGCELCSYRTADRNNLTRHLKTHESVKPYGCEHCSYRTADRNNLTRHFKTHASEKPYGCEHCSYRTAGRQNLTRHLKTHKCRR